MSINKVRNLLYTISRFLGDVNAIQKGKIGERIVRRASGRLTGNFMNKIIRSLFKKWLYFFDLAYSNQQRFQNVLLLFLITILKYFLCVNFWLFSLS